MWGFVRPIYGKTSKVFGEICGETVELWRNTKMKESTSFSSFLKEYIGFKRES